MLPAFGRLNGRGGGGGGGGGRGGAVRRACERQGFWTKEGIVNPKTP